MGIRPEKFSRWSAGARPERRAELAMADLLDVDIDHVETLGWPDWLGMAVSDDRALLASPWTPDGSVRALKALQRLGGPAAMERRGFLITSGALAATLAGLGAAAPAEGIPVSRRRPRINGSTVELIEKRLDHLRQLDDQVGSGQAYRLARAELDFITDTLGSASYTTATGRRLHSAAAEASRICGWVAFDSGDPATAERYYLAALRTAASADDPVAEANTLSFWAMARYSDNDTTHALGIVEEALRAARKTGSPRMIAMLHARAARAHAKAGDQRASRFAEGAAFEAYHDAGPLQDEPACMYWVTLAEFHNWAASNALDLADPARALTHHKALAALRGSGPDAHAYPRSTALHLARKADAQLANGDVDAAAHTAGKAVQAISGVGSVRGSDALGDLRHKFSRYDKVPAVRDFLHDSAFAGA
ncbi:transcriptional regulator [Streptomyces griseocarneus]|nr:transcriptional regulator [Streptomyces griseocarneus]